jgi:sporadic carbohydrate cluster protein (TIGR04323 family)
MELLLSATEVIMPNSYLMLEQLLNELSELDGIVCYSLFQLPINPIKRKQVFNTILDSDKSIHFAVEALSATEASDVNRLEDIFLVRNALGAALEPEDLRQTLLSQGLTNQDG